LAAQEWVKILRQRSDFHKKTPGVVEPVGIDGVDCDEELENNTNVVEEEEKAWAAVVAETIHQESILGGDELQWNDDLEWSGDDYLENFKLPVKYDPVSFLGSGTFGSVILVRKVSTGEFLAVKIIPNVFACIEEASRVLSELQIMRQLHHPYTLRLKDVFVDGSLEDFSSVYLVSERFDTNLNEVLRRGRKQLTEQHIKLILYQILCGLKYMHSVCIIHRYVLLETRLHFPR
jgi:hypothetical protein